MTGWKTTILPRPHPQHPACALRLEQQWVHLPLAFPLKGTILVNSDQFWTQCDSQKPDCSAGFGEKNTTKISPSLLNSTGGSSAPNLLCWSCFAAGHSLPRHALLGRNYFLDLKLCGSKAILHLSQHMESSFNSSIDGKNGFYTTTLPLKSSKNYFYLNKYM